MCGHPTCAWPLAARAALALAALAVRLVPPVADPGSPPAPDRTLPPSHLIHPPETGNLEPGDPTLWYDVLGVV